MPILASSSSDYTAFLRANATIVTSGPLSKSTNTSGRLRDAISKSAIVLASKIASSVSPTTFIGKAVVVAIAYMVSTLAGNGTAATTDGLGAAASFKSISGIAVDSAGNTYVGETGGHVIRKITPAGLVSTLAGSGTAGSTDAQGTSASFNSPDGVAVDSAGNVYVADTTNHLIRKITPGGLVSTLAGNVTGGYADGQGTSALFFYPRGITVDSAGNVYVADSNSNRIRAITPGGLVSTVAGSGTATFADGQGTAASFKTPYDIAVDSAGYLYVADTTNNRIRKITPGGLVSTLAGNGTSGSTDGQGTAATFNGPEGIAVDSTRNVYVADRNGNVIRKITPGGLVSTFAGTGSATPFADGLATTATFKVPSGIAVQSSGTVFVADQGNYRVRKIVQV